MKQGMRLTFLTPPFSQLHFFNTELGPCPSPGCAHSELCVLPATNTQPCAPHGQALGPAPGHVPHAASHLDFSAPSVLFFCTPSTCTASCYPLALLPKKAYLLGWEISSSWFMQHLFLRHSQALSPNSTWWRSNIAPGLHDPVLLI